MLTFHFLNVGHGDCTFVELPSGHLTIVNINNSKSLPDEDVEALAASRGLSVAVFKSRSRGFFEGTWEEYYRSLLVDPYDYYAEHFSGRSIFRYVQTHPDMDHMSGLHRFFWQEAVSLENFWDVPHNKNKGKDDFENSPYSYEDWLVYEALRSGSGPDNSKHNVIKNVRGDQGQYWTNDQIQVFSPTDALISACNTSENYNNCSYVLKVTYAGRSVILPGDAEGSAWSSMLDDLDLAALDCDVLKASHHGRDSGYHDEAVKTMAPEIVICSVGKKPSTDASDRYASQGAQVLSTRYCGTITVTIEDNGEVVVRNHKGENIAGLSKLY